MTSKHFDDMIAIAQAWPGRLPSELLRHYAPEVTRRWHVTPADWYAFDLAATVRWSELQREQQERQRELEHPGQLGQSGRTSAPTPMPTSVRASASAVRDQGDQLSIRGNEIPPWDPRYRAKAARAAS